jgi:hypothetical protein
MAKIKRKGNWDRILNGQRRPGVTARGSRESWQRAFRIRMMLEGNYVSPKDNFVLSYFGLSEGFSLAELKKAWRKKMFEVHPDRGGSNEEVHECNRLYEELKIQVS